MSLTPPQPPPSWDHSPGEITQLTNELIAHDRALQDKIGALDPKDSNFESVSFKYSFFLRFPNNYLSFKVFVSYRLPSPRRGINGSLMPSVGSC